MQFTSLDHEDYSSSHAQPCVPMHTQTYTRTHHFHFIFTFEILRQLPCFLQMHAVRLYCCLSACHKDAVYLWMCACVQEDGKLDEMFMKICPDCREKSVDNCTSLTAITAAGTLNSFSEANDMASCSVIHHTVCYCQNNHDRLL